MSLFLSLECVLVFLLNIEYKRSQGTCYKGLCARLWVRLANILLELFGSTFGENFTSPQNQKTNTFVQSVKDLGKQERG